MATISKSSWHYRFVTWFDHVDPRDIATKDTCQYIRIIIGCVMLSLLACATIILFAGSAIAFLYITGIAIFSSINLGNAFGIMFIWVFFGIIFVIGYRMCWKKGAGSRIKS